MYQAETELRALWDSSAWQAVLQKMAQQINISYQAKTFFSREKTEWNGRGLTMWAPQPANGWFVPPAALLTRRTLLSPVRERDCRRATINHSCCKKRTEQSVKLVWNADVRRTTCGVLQNEGHLRRWSNKDHIYHLKAGLITATKIWRLINIHLACTLMAHFYNCFHKNGITVVYLHLL